HLFVQVAVNVLVQGTGSACRQRATQDCGGQYQWRQRVALRRDHHRRDRGEDQQHHDPGFGQLEVIAEGAAIWFVDMRFDCCNHTEALTNTIMDHVAAANVTCSDSTTTNHSRTSTRTTEAPIAAWIKYAPSASSTAPRTSDAVFQERISK